MLARNTAIQILIREPAFPPSFVLFASFVTEKGEENDLWHFRTCAIDFSAVEFSTLIIAFQDCSPCLRLLAKVDQQVQSATQKLFQPQALKLIPGRYQLPPVQGVFVSNVFPEGNIVSALSVSVILLDSQHNSSCSHFISMTCNVPPPPPTSVGRIVAEQ